VVNAGRCAGWFTDSGAALAIEPAAGERVLFDLHPSTRSLLLRTGSRGGAVPDEVAAGGGGSPREFGAALLQQMHNSGTEVAAHSSTCLLVRRNAHGGCFFIALVGGELSLCLAQADGTVVVHHRFWTTGPCLSVAVDPAGGLMATVSSAGLQQPPVLLDVEPENTVLPNLDGLIATVWQFSVDRTATPLTVLLE
jgi:hypothetical protein